MISAVFEDTYGCRFEERFPTKGAFLRSIKRNRVFTFLHATDYERGVAIYPSTLWNYRNLMK